jgi:CHAT domain-containing protein
VGEEGAANIVNAFIEVGAQSVVSMLWELEDYATAHLMTDFYADLSHREEKAEALREAQFEIPNSGGRHSTGPGLYSTANRTAIYSRKRETSLQGATDDNEFRRQSGNANPDLTARSTRHSQ